MRLSDSKLKQEKVQSAMGCLPTAMHSLFQGNSAPMSQFGGSQLTPELGPLLVQYLSGRARNVSHRGSFLGLVSPLATYGSTGPNSVQLLKLSFQAFIYNLSWRQKRSRGCRSSCRNEHQCNTQYSQQLRSARHITNEMVEVNSVSGVVFRMQGQCNCEKIFTFPYVRR